MLLAMNLQTILILSFLCTTSYVEVVRGYFQVAEKQPMDGRFPPSFGGVGWILNEMSPQYDWGENTHRAMIALKVGKPRTAAGEITKMELQLENVLTNELLKNSTSTIHKIDLALYVHALIATKRNPRDFHGIDLVADLLHRVNSDSNVHPFLVLALCNAHAVEVAHLDKIKRHASNSDMNSTYPGRDTEMKALTLKALACAASLEEAHSRKLDKYQDEMDEAAKSLLCRQVNGIFGNVFTTALAVQALTAYGKEWDEERSLDYLRKESDINVSLIKAYYIEMALNARRVKFIKDLYDGSYEPQRQIAAPEMFLTLTVKIESLPHEDFSVVTKVPRNWNLFQVMEQAAKLSHRYRFSYTMNKDQEPIIFQVDKTPNDPEKDMYWRICRQATKKDLSSSEVATLDASPAKLQPLDGEHIILWYGSTGCPSF